MEIKIKKLLNILADKIYEIKNKYFNYNTVVYFPYFDSNADISNHYYRASWYLPYLPNKLEKIYFFHLRKIKININPNSYMSNALNNNRHIYIKSNFKSYLKLLIFSKVILVWKNYNWFAEYILKFIGIRLVNIDTYDNSAIEYGKYCGILWNFIIESKDRIKILNENRLRFKKISEQIEEKKYSYSCVFGTAPSIEKALDFNFKKCLSIVCNSIVKNQTLINHIKPAFITAGDVVSHFGVSKYAEAFRKDLIKILLLNNSIYLVTTANFGYLFVVNHPEIRHKTILIDQNMNEPNFNLLKNYGLPRLDSTLNIHMLPLAATFTNTIFMLGCDGKIPNVDNEDFWAHSNVAQYHEFVDSGHLCHPTFAVHRQINTYTRYLKSLEQTVRIGEDNNSKKYYTLSKSYIPILNERLVDHNEIMHAGLCNKVERS
ncbi:MAG: hypothetical protein JW786_12180 [Desulfobacterales bacterium]|nr:hypothetical protein [Desulfobacterales bacterium]